MIKVFRESAFSSPSIFDKENVATCGINNPPAFHSAVTNLVGGTNRIDLSESILDVNVVAAPSLQVTADFSSVFDFPLNASVESSVRFFLGTEAEHKTNKDMGPSLLVDADCLSVLDTTTIEMEESEILLGDDEGSNKAPIGLLNKNLPTTMVSQRD